MSDDGSLTVEVAGVQAQLRTSGALWLEAERALVCADLHLEKGSAYAARGQMLPPYDTREALRRLAQEVEALEPRLIVLLGDAFHDCAAEDRLCREDAEALSALASGRSLLWVLGNHDPAPPRALPGEWAAELALGGLSLRHEPAAAPARGEAAGHLHPCARVLAGGRSVRRRCFVTDGERLLLPAFGAYAGGLSVLDSAIGSLFRSRPLVVVLGSRRAHPVSWTSLAQD
ncbi:MAG TPA: ligase-associated DNA damage response endonuclease PdeM [Caulobacteraceae bacterium]